MGDPRADLGRQGEKLAERFLRARGMATLARRYRTPAGEIDLIMRDGDTIVFVEVKTRRDDSLSDPEHAVNAAKRGKLIRCARAFVARRKLHERPFRFDIISIILAEDSKPTLRHIPDAFAPERW